MNIAGEWIRTADKLPPITKTETILAYTYFGQLFMCGFDGDVFFNTFIRNGDEMMATWTATGVPYWCEIRSPLVEV